MKIIWRKDETYAEYQARILAELRARLGTERMNNEETR